MGTTTDKHEKRLLYLLRLTPTEMVASTILDNIAGWCFIAIGLLAILLAAVFPEVLSKPCEALFPVGGATDEHLHILRFVLAILGIVFAVPGWYVGTHGERLELHLLEGEFTYRQRLWRHTEIASGSLRNLQVELEPCPSGTDFTSEPHWRLLLKGMADREFEIAPVIDSRDSRMEMLRDRILAWAKR